jgi:hypothetical protein
MTFAPSNKKATGDEIVTTSCCECVFAEYVGGTQTGCSMGRLEKYRKNGTTVLEAHNDEKEFFVVERFCSAFRDSEWKDVLFYYSDDLSEKPEDRVRREIKIRCGVFIGFDDTCDINDLEKTLASIWEQVLQPLYITVANSSKISNLLIMDVLRSHFEDGDETVYTCSHVDVNELSTKEQTEIPEIWRAIDSAFKTTAKNGYYAATRAGNTFSKDYLSSINHYINEEMRQVILIKSEDNSEEYFIQCSLHKLMYGSNGKFIVDKVVELSEEQDLYHMTTDIKTVKEIYESATSNNSNSQL